MHEIRPALPPHVFDPVPSRLAWLALHVALIVAGVTALYLRLGGWWAVPVYSLVIGHSFAGCAFVGHEMMHGAVVRNVRWRYALGWICFVPFTLSPRLWVAWHNKTHHGNTMSVAMDPDAYPTMAAYKKSRVTRVADYFALGAGHTIGFMTLLLGFTGQSAQMMWRWSSAPESMPRGERRLAVLETLAGYALWAGVGYLVGPLLFVFAFVLPLLVGNFVVISYIMTNHSLSPLTDVNDPLLNSLTVTVPGWVDRLHLNFGLHVEHHLFPSMSSAYAPLVRDQLVARYPERYQSLPIVTALVKLARTPRVYGSPTVLEDPRTGLRASTLLPREEVAAATPAPSSAQPPPVEMAPLAEPAEA